MVQPADLSQIHDKMHVFLSGFPQLRMLDAEGAGMMLENFVEAMEGLPLEVVARACKAWNQRKVQGVDYRYPPAPPEFRKAADDIMAALRVERREVESVMRALPAPAPLPPVTDEQRAECAARAADLVKSIADAGAKLDAELSDASAKSSRIEQAAYVRRFQAAEAERKARIGAPSVAETVNSALTVSSHMTAHVYGEPNAADIHET